MKRGLNVLLSPSYRWLLLGGLALRLVLMPLTLHSDILDQYWRSHFISHHGIMNLPRFMMERFGFPSAPVLFLDYFHGLYLWLIRPLLPDIHRLFGDGPEAMVVLTDLRGHQLAVLNFLAAGSAARLALLLFKLPYLLLDYFTLGLLLGLVEGERERRRLTAFWMFNFISLFALYMWGRYEILTSTFVVLALVKVSQKAPGRAMLMLGFATITKYYPIMLLPAWLVGLGRTIRSRLRHSLAFCVVPGMLALLGLLLVYDQPGKSLLVTGYQIKNVLRIAFDVGDIYWKEPLYLYPFVIGYSLLLLRDWYAAGQGMVAIVSSSLAYLMLFYALSAFSPQYFFWCLPLVALSLQRKNDIYWIHQLQVVFFVLSVLELGSDIGNLFSPVWPALVDAPLQPRYSEEIGEIYPALIGIGRSVFAALCLWMALLVLWQKAPSPPDSPESASI